MIATPKVDSIPVLDERILAHLLSGLDVQQHPLWVVAGVLPGDGVSTIAAALTRALSIGGKNVLLVDANFRGPTLHERFDVPRAPGFSDLVKGQAPLDAVAHPLELTKSKNSGRVHLVSAGSEVEEDVFEFLSSPAIKSCLDECRWNYDVTIIDTPPLESYLDAIPLAEISFGVVVVARAGKTTIQDVRAAGELFAKSNGKLLGVILNHYRDYIPRFLRRFV